MVHNKGKQQSRICLIANLCEHQAMKLIEILGRVDCFRYSWKCRLIADLKKVRVMDEDEMDKSITES